MSSNGAWSGITRGHQSRYRAMHGLSMERMQAGCCWPAHEPKMLGERPSSCSRGRRPCSPAIEPTIGFPPTSRYKKIDRPSRQELIRGQRPKEVMERMQDVLTAKLGAPFASLAMSMIKCPQGGRSGAASVATERRSNCTETIASGPQTHKPL